MKAVIFDVEGTLLNVTDALYYQFEALTAEFDGSKAPREAIRAAAHGTPEQTVRELVCTSAVPLNTITRRHQELRTEAYERHVKPYMAASELVLLVKSLGYKVAAVTHGDEHTLRALERAGMKQHFDTVIVATDMPKLQPHASGVQLALSKLSVAPEEAMLVGDAVNDVLAAKNAGILKVIAVRHGLSSAEALRAAGADHIVADIPAVLDVIG